MSINKSSILLICLIFYSYSEISDADVRNIFTVSSIDYDGIGHSMVVENTFVAKVHSRFSVLLRAYNDSRKSWNNNIFTLGPVINIGKYHYAELTYGFGRDSDGRRADYFSAEIVREMPKYLTGIGYMHRKYPGYTYSTLSPSLKYRITDKIALWGKSFASLDSDDNFDHAYWTDIEYKISPKFAVTLGYTGGNRLYSPEYETLFLDAPDMNFHSIIGQLSFSLKENISIKYLYEYMTRQTEYNDIKHVFILDARL